LTAIVEMLQTNLALENLKAEKHRLDEENERQAISKSVNIFPKLYSSYSF